MDPGAAAGGSSSRIDRTSAERERRMRLKDLFSRLSSLLPPQRTKLSTDQVIEQGTIYINQLRNRVEELKQMKLQAEEEVEEWREEVRSGLNIITPVINIIDLNSTLEVNLIAGWKGKLQLCDIIKILMEEAAEVIKALANQSAEDRIVYSIHCRAMCSRIGIATSRVQERLKDLVS